MGAVAIRPGLMVLARMPTGPPSTAMCTVRATTPALAAPCAPIGMSSARNAITEAVLTIAPPPRATRCGHAARVTRNTGSRSLRRVKRQDSTARESSGPRRAVAALL